jgi:hypothetical protein
LPGTHRTNSRIYAMKNTLIFLCVTSAAACEQHETKLETPKITESSLTPLPKPTPRPEPEPRPAAAAKRLFLDVHELGPGKVTAGAVADAHRKDLATQGKHGVDYKAYFLDEKHGKIDCLAEAPSAEAAVAVHQEAHGLLPAKIMEVTEDNASWRPEPGAALFLDVHHLDAGKVTAKDVAAAHAKDLAVQSKHGAKYLNYWFDQSSGTVMCLVQAPSAAAAVAVHAEAHGLLPESIERVSEGR